MNQSINAESVRSVGANVSPCPSPAGRSSRSITEGRTCPGETQRRRIERFLYRLRVDTPKKVTPRQLVGLIAGLIPTLPRFDRVSVGFPGVVRNGVVLTAPNLGTDRFHGFNLARALERRLGKPVRVENDADVQGLAVVKGKGVEMVITLGTGFGSSIFIDGRLGPHLELAHHVFRKDKTYEDELGEAARERDGDQTWQRHVREAIESLRNLTNFDHLYVGGALPRDVSVVSNTAGILGGVRLWA